MKAYLAFALKLIVAGVFLHYAGQLSLRSSISIVAVVGLTWPWVKREVDQQFEPFEMRLEPRIGLMLIDAGLITQEQWETLRGTRPPFAPWTSFHPVYYGLNAVVLDTKESGDYLVHWHAGNYPNHYTSTLATTMPLDFLKMPGGLLGWSPEFYIRPGRGGYEIGLTVVDEWWEENKERLTAAGDLRTHEKEWQFGTVRLTFDTIPVQIFRPYHLPWSQKLIDGIKTEVAPLGWKTVDMNDAEVGYLGELYQGKYADVRLLYIPRGF